MDTFPERISVSTRTFDVARPDQIVLPLPHTAAATHPGPDNTIAWLVFAIGGPLIAVAWRASLRARPLRPAHARTSTS